MYFVQTVSRVVLIILIFLIPISCATQSGLSDDGIVNLNHFSFSKPENPLWNYGYSRSSQEHFFRLTTGDENYSINFEENRVLGGAKQLTTDSIVAYFLVGVTVELSEKARSNEQSMTRKFGQISVNNKKFYTLDYTMKKVDHCSNGEIYVHFPFEKQNAYFLFVHYQETTRDCLKITETIDPERLEIHQDFRKFLGSLVHRL